MKEYLKLLGFVKGQRRRFMVAVLFMFITSLLEGIQFSFLIPIVDRIFSNKKIVVPNEVPEFISRGIEWFNNLTQEQLYELFIPLVLGVLVLMLIKQSVTICYEFLMNDIAQSIMRDIRLKLYTKMQHLSLDYFSKKRTGELISRITNDVQAIENSISYGITDLFKQPFLIIIFVVAAFVSHFQAAMVIFVMFPAIALPVIIISRKLRKLAKGAQEKIADINSHLLETISGVRVVKAFGTEEYEIDRFRQQNFQYYRLKMKSVKRMIVTGPLTEMIGAACAVVMIIVLGQQVISGKISFGVVIFFISSVLQIIRPVKRMVNIHTIAQQALAANERIYDVLETKPTVVEKPNAKQIGVMKDAIELKNVVFGYDRESGNVLHEVDLKIKRGEVVAIVGPTGTGKSTLVNLIPRFYDPTGGTILMDGNDLKDVSFTSLRSQIGIVTQETILFNDTVRNNIAYGLFDAPIERIKDAARRAHAAQFIEKMPQGYDTMIGDRGFRLSGGEKQRLAIARAILKNPPILILDEATSQLDAESEKYVQEALDQLMEGRTVIAIAHRFSTIKRADKIVVLQSGRIVGMGKHEELMTSCPLYHRLYETQFQL